MITTVFLELTNYCNMNCDFCTNHQMTRQKGFMSTENAKKVIYQLNQMKFKGSLITSLMGEPLLHPKFYEILKYSVQSGIKTNVITNFLLVPEKIAIDDLLNFGIDTLCLSYQTPDEESFKARRVKYSFDDYFKKIIKILSFSLNNSFKTRRIEVHLLQSLYNYLNIEIINDYPLIETAIMQIYNALYQNNTVSIKKNCDKDNILQSIKNFKRGNQYQDAYEIQIAPKIYVVLKRANTWANTLLPEGCEVEPQIKGHCGFFESSLGIFWNGQCTVCCQDFNGAINIGNITLSSIKDILKNKTLINMREMEHKGQLINAYCQRCKGMIRRNGKKYSIVKKHGIINKGFNLANRVRNKLRNGI